jgi:hypothetical protein
MRITFSVRLLATLLAACFVSGTASADTCFKDYQTQKSFGSAEQTIALQELAKGNCPIIGIAGNITKPADISTLVVADLGKGEMVRLKIIDAYVPLGMSQPWEAWSGFTRQDLLNNKADGNFDLNGFVASRSGERPKLSPRIKAFIKDHKLSKFLSS